MTEQTLADFLNTISDTGLREVIRAIVAAGDAIKMIDRAFMVKEGEGHRSGVTAGDRIAEQSIVSALTRNFPEARILSEEDTSHPNILRKDAPEGILELPQVFIVDPTDGTALYGSKLDGWCVGAGEMRRGRLISSVIYAPATNNGVLVVAESEGSVRVAEWDWSQVTTYGPVASKRPSRQSIFLTGVNTMLYPSVAATISNIVPNFKAHYTKGSGLFALAMVACGRAQAVLQPPEKVWDWAPAYRAVKQGGNVFKFFRLIDEPDWHPDPAIEPEKQTPTRMLVPIEHYDRWAFVTLKEDTQSRLGFVAGEPAFVEKIWNELPRRGWLRVNPDTVSGTWE